MNKYIYFTDTHYGAKPINRSDKYNQSILKKFKFCLDLALKNKCIVLHGGDLFDAWKVPFIDLIKMMDVLHDFKSKGGLFYTIIGNDAHDGRLEQSPVKILEKANLVKLLDGFIDDGDVRIIAAGHGSDPVTASVKYANTSQVCILLTHYTIVKNPVIFDHVLWSDFNCPIDVCCCAHYHPYQGVEWVKMGGGEAANGGEGSGEKRAILFVAPGALARRKKTSHDINRIPKLVYLQVKDKKISFKEIDIPCSQDIWVNNLKLEIEETISENVEIKKEISHMREVIDQSLIFTNIEDAIRTYGKRHNYSSETIEYTIKEIAKL